VAEQGVFGQYVARRNAAVVQISGLMMVIFLALVVVAAAILIAGSRHGSQPSARRVKPVSTLAALTSAVGLLLSSSTLYLTYRPYWYILQTASLSGGWSQVRDLRDFLAATQLLPFRLGFESSWTLPVYFWTAVVVLCVISLVLILLRHLVVRPHPGGVQHSPRVL
jgi:hypothetical protein